MGQPSTNWFHTPFERVVQATETAHLHHQVQEPAKTADMVPGLQHISLLRINKFVEANYVAVFMPD